jgi:kanamycin nucleotidyltransferase
VGSKAQLRRAQKSFVREKLRIAHKLSTDLKRELGANLIAIGVIGSVARGRAEKYSDIDMEIIVRDAIPESYQARIVENTYCSLTFATRSVALQEVTQPHPDLPERLGGFTKIHRLYDPKAFLRTLQTKATHVPRHLFIKSAELALLHSYEDFCRVKNAYLNGDDVVLRDNVMNVTHSAALVTASLNNTPFISDRDIFKAYKRFQRLPEGFWRIEDLRYGCLKRRELFRSFTNFYLELVDFCAKEGVRLPVDRQTLQASSLR